MLEMKTMHNKYFIFNPSYFVNTWTIVEMFCLQSHLRNVHNLTRRGRRPKEPLDLELAKLLGLGNLLTFLVFLYKPIKTFKNIIF